MDTRRSKAFGRRTLLVFLTSILLLIAVSRGESPAGADEGDKQQVVQQVAQRWIQVGTEQYRKGFFKAAEQSFLRAQDYQEYLSVAEREKINELLEKTHVAAIERARILEHIRSADELVKQSKFVKAKAHLEKVKDSEFLTEKEHVLVADGLTKIDEQIKMQKAKIAKTYKRSVELYNAGKLEKAREGFFEVAQSGLFEAQSGKTAEEYLAKIDEALMSTSSVSVKPEKEEAVTEDEAVKNGLAGIEGGIAEKPKGQQVEQEQPASQEQSASQEQPVSQVAEQKAKVVEQTTKEVTYIDEINRKKDILRSYVRAIVNDAISKSQDNISHGEFDKAKESVEKAERAVNKNQMDLGDELSQQYNDELKKLRETINREQKRQTEDLEKKKQSDAMDAQRLYREQMETDRNKRIAELMGNAVTYQKQQRYEEALGQLESVLAVEPLNEQAMILKQTLDDTVSFRKQLEVQKEVSKEGVGIMLKTDESAIPYADEITYPKNWREIVAKRTPEEAIGENPADAGVYEQLDKIVDLSELTSETPFAQAIGTIKNAVQPPLQIVVLWKDLSDNASIEQTTPINMDGVSGVPLNAVLSLLLKSIGGSSELGYMVSNGVITIGTTESLPSKLETLVYDVTDLLGRPADFRADTRGGSGGGGGSKQNVGGGFAQQDTQSEQNSSEERRTQSERRGGNLVYLIQQTIEPESWYDSGGEGTVTVYESKKLVVLQTRDNHNKIKKLLAEMRRSLGQQVAIEARFLLVGEDFLENIGLNVNFQYKPGGKLGTIAVTQNSSSAVVPTDTGVGQSWGGMLPAMTVTGGYGSILDDLQVNLILNATQAQSHQTNLTEPKVTVLSGENATMKVEKTFFWPDQIQIETQQNNAVVGSSLPTYTVNYQTNTVLTGPILNVSPTILPDKKHILLYVEAQLTQLLDMRSVPIDLALYGIQPGQAAGQMTIQYPDVETSRVQTRVSVPDGGTLLLGGQKLTAEIEEEVGVPVLSKLPLIGRLFDNRSKIKDHKILLILIKPTIILQQERENEAIAAMEKSGT